MLDVKQLEIRYVTNKAGDKMEVIMPIDDFRELMEDIEDLAAVAERREGRGAEPRSMARHGRAECDPRDREGAP